MFGHFQSNQNINQTLGALIIFLWLIVFCDQSDFFFLQIRMDSVSSTLFSLCILSSCTSKTGHCFMFMQLNWSPSSMYLVSSQFFILDIYSTSTWFKTASHFSCSYLVILSLNVNQYLNQTRWYGYGLWNLLVLSLSTFHKFPNEKDNFEMVPKSS